MDNALALLMAGGFGATVTLLASLIAARAQKGVATINANKDLIVHSEKIADARLTNEISFQRGKLEQLHRILSRIGFEYSQTASYMDSDNDLDLKSYRQRCRDIGLHIDEAVAIVDMHYPEMSHRIREVCSQASIYWGSQEGVLRTNPTENRAGWEEYLAKVLEATRKISADVSSMQASIAESSAALCKSLDPEWHAKRTRQLH